MAVLDVPELMNMFRQDELQKQAVAEAQRKQALEERAMTLKEQPDVDFTFEKGGLKVKGKLKDLPTLSQDPAFAPYLAGIGSTISNEQNLNNEEIALQRDTLNEKMRDLQKKKLTQELELAKGDTRTGAFEMGLGLIGAKPRADVMKDIEAEAGVYRKKLAELSFNRQTGQMETEIPQDASSPLTLETPAPETPATEQPASTQQAPRSFKTSIEARAAGVQPGELITVNGKLGRLPPKR